MASLGCLGQVVFQVSANYVETYEKLSRRARFVYADHEVALGKPASEYTGPDLDDVSLTMVFNATLGVSPKAETDKLRNMGLSGKAHMLMIGNDCWGFFTIREVGDDVIHSLEGAPMVVSIDVKIKEYEENLPGPGSEAAARDAASRGATGKGGPEKVPGAGECMQSRELTRRE